LKQTWRAIKKSGGAPSHLFAEAPKRIREQKTKKKARVDVWGGGGKKKKNSHPGGSRVSGGLFGDKGKVTKRGSAQGGGVFFVILRVSNLIKGRLGW